MAPTPRPPRDWPGDIPVKLIPVTGLRDQQLRITYIPWSDVWQGLVGWQVLPDRSLRTLPLLVYVVPVVGNGAFEIRCHVAANEPDPNTDELLGKFTIPSDMFRDES